MSLGEMPMPSDFRFKNVAEKGRPRHSGWDSFTVKHPPMPPEHWAKIFSPFDALRGFGDFIASKEVEYSARRELNEDDEAELNRRLSILHGLTWNSRMARRNSVRVTVRHYVPCGDKNSFAWGKAGSVIETDGTVMGVDTEGERLTLLAGQKHLTVEFENIVGIESKSGIFEAEWEI